MANLDAHAKPPEAIRLLYKRHQKLPVQDINTDPEVFDFQHQSFAGCTESSLDLSEDIQQVFSRFLGEQVGSEVHMTQSRAYEHPRVPGTYNSIYSIAYKRIPVLKRNKV